MIGRLTMAAAALVLMVACANVEPAGRNAQRNSDAATLPPPAAQTSPLPPPARQSNPLPPPRTTVTPAPTLPAPAPTTTQQTLPPPQASNAPPVAAANVAAPPPPRVAPPQDDGEVVVPGVVQRQVPPPNGDPRSVAERAADIRSWDRCVTRVQSAGESDPTRPQLDSPEEVCSRSLGMASRTAVPDSRQPRR